MHTVFLCDLMEQNDQIKLFVTRLSDFCDQLLVTLFLPSGLSG